MACLDGRVGLELVRPQPRVVVRHLSELLCGGFRVALQQLSEGAFGVEGLDLPRAVQLVPDVVEPDHLAVRGVEERAADAVEVEAAVVRARGRSARPG